MTVSDSAYTPCTRTFVSTLPAWQEIAALLPPLQLMSTAAAADQRSLRRYDHPATQERGEAVRMPCSKLHPLAAGLEGERTMLESLLAFMQASTDGILT